MSRSIQLYWQLINLYKIDERQWHLNGFFIGFQLSTLVHNFGSEYRTVWEYKLAITEETPNSINEFLPPKGGSHKKSLLSQNFDFGEFVLGPYDQAP